MTGKIFRSVISVCTLVLFAAALTIVGVLYVYFSGSMNAQLKSQLHFAVQGVISGGTEYLDCLEDSDYRLTLIGADGKVISDTEADASTMDNHSGRAEIISAAKTGTGESTRYSATLLEETMYFAERLPDGRILRISATRYSVLTLVLGVVQPIIFILAGAIVLSAFLAKRMSDKIVEPLNSLDLENPLDNEAYDELAPLLSHIERQNRKIAYQMNELKKSQNEFSAVVENMNEALVLLGADGRILAINNAALRLFKTNSDCVGRDFFTVERDPAVEEAAKRAEQEGGSEIYIDRGGREYQINISRIAEHAEASGAVVLAFDVTDRVFAERNRREFTANVSHELKTPLQSIMGSAELIENGLVKSADTARFAGNIRTEASRLVTLIDDIIRLSQLDEKSEMPFETVDLYAVANAAAQELERAAEKRNIKISVAGKSTVINAVGRLVHEIAYNLTENAVKYNVAGGSVEVEVFAKEGCAKMLVKDTGIGIPQEHLSRVFERFYRVDKSHSKETGGTGLGLSIVKHAAEYLGAQVEIESKSGSGTTVTVIFKECGK